MGKVVRPEKVKLIAGMLAPSQALFARAERAMAKKYGPIDYKSPVLKFDYTDYYQKEMGKRLFRKFVSFKKLIRQDDVAAVKVFTNKIEEKNAKNKKRKINIDPGYLTLAKLVLATTKDHQHRLYIGKGIYAEVTLRYTKDSFTYWPWTYPDYRTKEYTAIFNRIREAYRQDERRKL